jgi:hypothetical protein
MSSEPIQWARVGKGMAFGGVVAWTGIALMAMTLINRPDEPTFVMCLRIAMACSIVVVAIGVALDVACAPVKVK